MFTSACHLFLSWARSIQSMPCHPTSWRSILILSSHLCLGLPSGFFHSDFSTRTLYAPLLSPLHAICPAHLILLDLITWIIGVENRSLRRSVLCRFLHFPDTLVPCTPTYSQTPSTYVTPSMWLCFTPIKNTGKIYIV
jgi:hypothetical protein